VPVLVFSDRGRRMGLIVDEIIDIVEQRLDIEVASERPGLVGYAVVKGSATEIVDIAHFLPQAYAGWRRRDPRPLPAVRRIMLVDDSAFFRDMLAPLIKAAGYQVAAVASAEDALAALQSGTRFDLVVTDIEMPDMDGFELASRCAQIRAPPPSRSSRSPPWSPPTRSSAAARSASTISSPSSTEPDWWRRSRSRVPIFIGWHEQPGTAMHDSAD
jgi:CheY-like chemotaxis protein